MPKYTHTHTHSHQCNRKHQDKDIKPTRTRDQTIIFWYMYVCLSQITSSKFSSGFFQHTVYAWLSREKRNMCNNNSNNNNNNNNNNSNSCNSLQYISRQAPVQIFPAMRSYNRIDLLSYESKPTDKRKQYDWMSEKNLYGLEHTKKTAPQFSMGKGSYTRQYNVPSRAKFCPRLT